jgi:hypothetical protein
MYIQVGIPLTVEWMAMNSHYIAHVIKIIFCNKVISKDHFPYNFGIYINRNLLFIGIAGIVILLINNNITYFKC